MFRSLAYSLAFWCSCISCNHRIKDTSYRKYFWQKIWVLIFSPTVSKAFLWRKNSSLRCNHKFTYVFKTCQIPGKITFGVQSLLEVPHIKVTEVCPLGSELLHTDREMDRHDEAKSRFRNCFLKNKQRKCLLAKLHSYTFNVRRQSEF